MKQTIFFVALFTVIMLVVGCALQQESASPATIEKTVSHVEEPAMSTVGEEKEPKETEELVVEITADGFHPDALTVSVGDTVTFVNNDRRQHWPASDPYPKHTGYPGTDIKECGDVEERVNMFDACKGLLPGESYSFTFNEKGNWGYHDHIRSQFTGTIVVE